MAESDKVTTAVNYVFMNVDYTSDLEKYGFSDYWMDPRGLLYYEEGDCEDLAFFVHSLLLNGDVPGDRLRTYFGYFNGTGHAWVAYKRRSDNKWVILDATAGTISDVNSLPLAINNSPYTDAWAYLTNDAYVVIPSGEYLASYGLSSGAVDWLELTCSGAGIWNWNGAVSLEPLTCLGYGGFRVSFSLPVLTLSGTGKINNVGELFLNWIPIRISGTGLSGIVGNHSSSLKILSLSGTGYTIPGGSGSQTLRAFVCSGVGRGDRFSGYILRYSRQ